MTPAQIIHRAMAAGIVFSLTESGRLRLGGDRDAIHSWLGEIGQHETELIAELQHQCLLGLQGGPLANDQQVAGATITTAENKTHHGAESGPHAAQRSMTNG